MYQFSTEAFWESIQTIAGAAHITLGLTFGSFLLAFVLAIFMAMLSMSKNHVIQWILRVWISLFRGTPLLAQLFFFVYGLFPVIPWICDWPLLPKGILCLALAFAAFMSETIRGAIQSVDKGQMEACLSCGMTTGQAYRRVILPQAFHLAVPSLMNNFIECFKGTALVSMVGVTDMMLTAKMLTARNLRFVEGYLAVLLLYWVINMVFVAIQKRLELRMGAKY